MRSLSIVTGASRGLGLEFCRQVLQRRGADAVVATCRDPQGASADGLRELEASSGGRLTIEALNVASEASIEAFGEGIAAQSAPVSLLINCAGILAPDGKGETSLRAVDAERLQKTMAVNAFGPLLMARHIGTLMVSNSRIINLSARVGSIGDNRLGGWYAYRMSKAALNQATKTMAIELKRRKVCVVAVHPGTVATDLTLPYRGNIKADKLLTPEESIARMLNVCEAVPLDDTGCFIDYAGEPVAW